MRARGQRHKQVARRIRRYRRRLGRFVVFAEMLADLRPISLLDQTVPTRIGVGASHAAGFEQIRELREQGAP